MHSLAFTLEDFQLNEIIHHLSNHLMKIMPIYIKNKISISLKIIILQWLPPHQWIKFRMFKIGYQARKCIYNGIAQVINIRIEFMRIVYFTVWVSTMMNAIIDIIICKYIIYYVRKE